VTSIRQFVPALYPRDAIGGHVLRLHHHLEDRGINSSIVVEADHNETAQFTTNLSSLDDSPPAPGSNTINVYHMATGADLAEAVMARPEPLVLVHHDLTPLDLVSPWDDEVVHRLTLARRQLERLANRADLGIGVSEHNRLQLTRAGCDRTTVAPLVFDLRPESTRAQDKPTTDPTILFVGRFAPNKAQHDLIAAFELVVKRWPRARLRLIGGSGIGRYLTALRRYVDSLGLTDSVTFEQSVGDSQLDAAYSGADLFCCLSDHEGFGMPLVEAMHRGVPVIAFDAAAVAETVAGAGLVLDTKSPSVVATAIDHVFTHTDLRLKLSIAGQLRARDFGADSAVDRFLAVVALNIDGASFERASA